MKIYHRYLSFLSKLSSNYYDSVCIKKLIFNKIQRSTFIYVSHNIMKSTTNISTLTIYELRVGRL